jgi:hypothetical protein
MVRLPLCRDFPQNACDYGSSKHNGVAGRPEDRPRDIDPANRADLDAGVVGDGRAWRAGGLSAWPIFRYKTSGPGPCGGGNVRPWFCRGRMLLARFRKATVTRPLASPVSSDRR